MSGGDMKSNQNAVAVIKVLLDVCARNDRALLMTTLDIVTAKLIAASVEPADRKRAVGLHGLNVLALIEANAGGSETLQ